MNLSQLRFVLIGLLCGIAIGLFGQENYQPSTVIIKLKPEHKHLFKSGTPDQLFEVWNKHQLSAPKQMFTHSDTKSENQVVDVSLIYEIKYGNNYSPIKLSKLLFQSGFFEYSEPKYIGKLAFTPNDTRYSQQSYLLAIGAEQAWDSSKGSSSILIGLLDAGVDTSHEDFSGKFYKNTADPINSVDDDNDGFVDNLNGWNFRTSNHNIMFSSVTHGVQMAGAMAPNTNNSKGIAGVGFNSRILPVVVTDASDLVAYGYEGIKYAADKGCKVINCSWNIKAYSDFGFDMVKYATLDKGALVVAAMGNEGSDDNNYPAMYPYVLGVSAVDNNGFRVSNSNYSYGANLSAPGLQILTTDKNNTYIKNTGTSLSSAIVSGAAALLFGKFPSLSPIEVSSYLKARAKNIYANGQNGQYIGKLGAGMLHIGNAMSHDGSAFAELVSTKVTEKQNGVIESGDTVQVVIDVANYLAISGNVTAYIESENLYSTLVVSSISLGTISKNDTVSNSGIPFKIVLKSNTPQNKNLDYSLRLVEAGDTSIYGFAFRANTAYQIIETSKIKTALGNRGTVGWYRYPQKEGVGFIYKGGNQLLYESGLMIGTNSGSIKVVDRIRGIRDVEQTDFLTTHPLMRTAENGIPFSLSGAFSDTASKDNEIGLLVSQKAYAWPGEPTRENLVILQYTIKSAFNFTLNDIYVGLLVDWDIEDFDKNRAKYEDFRYLAYTYSTEGIGPYCGVQLLNNLTKRKIYNLDHINGGAGGVDITDNDVFSKSEKFTTLSTFRQNAGTQTGGNDVLQIVSTGGHTINPGDSLVFQVALLVADSLKELQQVADTAFWLANNRIPDFVESPEAEIDQNIKVYPNPTSSKLFVENSLEIEGAIVVRSIDGKVLQHSQIHGQETIELNLESLRRGTYILQIKTANRSLYRKIVKN